MREPGRCIDCGGSFSELELQFAKDGSGTGGGAAALMGAVKIVVSLKR